LFLKDKTFEYIFILQNQYLAKQILKGYDHRAKKRMFRGLIINADFENYYFISDFLDEFNPEYNKPFFFIFNKDFEDIYNILTKNTDLLCKIEYDNYNSFFPKNYLQFLNYSLIFALIGIFLYWTFLYCKYKSHLNDIHKWFTGILVLKCICSLFIIQLLNLNYYKSNNSSEDIYNGFKMIFYDTVLSATNVIYRSSFLFIFVMIFEVIKKLIKNYIIIGL
jgi:hypothetical protein